MESGRGEANFEKAFEYDMKALKGGEIDAAIKIGLYYRKKNENAKALHYFKMVPDDRNARWMIRTTLLAIGDKNNEYDNYESECSECSCTECESDYDI